MKLHSNANQQEQNNANTWWQGQQSGVPQISYSSNVNGRQTSFSIPVIIAVAVVLILIFK